MNNENLINASNIAKRKDNHTAFWHQLNQLTERIRVYNSQLNNDASPKKPSSRPLQKLRTKKTRKATA